MHSSLTVRKRVLPGTAPPPAQVPISSPPSPAPVPTSPAPVVPTPVSKTDSATQTDNVTIEDLSSLKNMIASHTSIIMTQIPALVEHYTELILNRINLITEQQEIKPIEMEAVAAVETTEEDKDKDKEAEEVAEEAEAEVVEAAVEAAEEVAVEAEAEEVAVEAEAEEVAVEAEAEEVAVEAEAEEVAVEAEAEEVAVEAEAEVVEAAVEAAEEVAVKEPIEAFKFKEEDNISQAVSAFNELFDATLIMDITGGAEGLASKLHALGVKNCVVVSPDFQDDCPAKDRIVYYIHSAIDTAKSEGWNTVNIIANHLRFHNNMFQIIRLAMDQIKTTQWDILHFCSSNHIYEPQQMDLENFQWEKYVVLNPDLPESIKSSKPRATQDWCARGHRIGRFAAPKLVETATSNTLAFAVKSSCYDEILVNLEKAIASPREIPLLDVAGPKLILAPNLFIVQGTPASVMKQLRWLPSLYVDDFKFKFT
jgi:hypothetical protein